MLWLKKSPVRANNCTENVIKVKEYLPYLSENLGAHIIEIIMPTKKQAPIIPISDYFLQSMSSFPTQLSKYSSSVLIGRYLFLGKFSAHISDLVQLFQESC